MHPCAHSSLAHLLSIAPALPPLQVFVGAVVLLRLQKERERRARVCFAAGSGMPTLAKQLKSHEQPLLGQAFELAVLASMLWPLCQQLAIWIS
jgi:hypothetical protein